jgi:polar amino acid transport system permease protein/polar amino acid transport system substrate-binding protein
MTLSERFAAAFITGDRWKLYLSGLGITIEIAIFSAILGIIIGTVLALMKLSNKEDGSPTIFNYIASIYIDVIRGTPSVLQLLIMWFIIMASSNNGILVASLSFGINSGAYVAEIFRAGIQSIDNGQMEAGRSLGMTWVQTMRYIIVPQAFKRVIPPLGNEFIALLKDSSLVSVIGFEELTRRGQLIIAKTYGSLEIWISVAIVYLVMTLTISRFVAYLEKRFATDDRH